MKNFRATALIAAALAACGSLAALAEEPAEDRPAWADKVLRNYRTKLAAAKREAEKTVRENLDVSKAAAQKEIAAIEKHIATVERAKRQSKNPKIIERSDERLEALNEELAGARKKAAEIEAGEAARIESVLKTVSVDPLSSLDELDPRSMQAGQVGRLRRWPTHPPNFEVLQIIDGENLLGHVRYVGGLPPYDPLLVWIEGLDTSDLVDGKKIELADAFVIARTKQYESRGGMKTVFVLKAIDEEELREAIAEAVGEKQKP